jgi:DhnA family fructose-bisphosphate aldolase class Ia
MSRQTLTQPEPAVIDLTDVPLVAMRELATALKFLSAEAQQLLRPEQMTEEDMRRVEQTFWQRCNRDRARKVAVLVRLRSLLEVCHARSIQALIAVHGQAAVLEALAVAATMRLNTNIGFNPQKLARAVQAALKSIELPVAANARPLAA